MGSFAAHLANRLDQNRATIERLTRERDEARAEVERLRDLARHAATTQDHIDAERCIRSLAGLPMNDE